MADPGTAYGTKIANRLNFASFIIPLSKARAKNRAKAIMNGTWTTRKIAIRKMPLRNSGSVRASA